MWSGELVKTLIRERLEYTSGCSQLESWKVVNYTVEHRPTYERCHSDTLYKRELVVDIEYITKRGRVGKVLVHIDGEALWELLEQIVREGLL